MPAPDNNGPLHINITYDFRLLPRKITHYMLHNATLSIYPEDK